MVPSVASVRAVPAAPGSPTVAAEGVAAAGRRVAVLIAAVVGLAGLAITGAVAVLSHDRARLHGDTLFERQSDLHAAVAVQALRRPVDWLQGLSAAAPLADADRAAWLDRAVDMAASGADRPDVALVGWASVVAGEDDAPVLAVDAVAGEGAGPAFAVGAVADSASIRDAVAQVRRLRRPILVPAVAWPGEPQAGVDHLVLAPVFDGRPGDAGTGGLRGVLFAGVSLARLAEPVLAGAHAGTVIRLESQGEDGRWQAHGSTPQPVDATHTRPVRATARAGADVPRRAVRVLDAGDRSLLMVVEGPPSDEEIAARERVRAAGLAGLLVSLLASLGAGRMALGRDRARRRADRLSADVERLAEVVRHTADAIAITDGRGRIEWINDGFTRLFGHGLEAAVGRTPTALLRMTAGEGGEPVRPEHLRDGDADGGRPEVVARASDGSAVWVELEIQHRVDAAGARVGCVFVAGDIRARKAAEQALQGAVADAGRLAEELGVMASAVRHAANGVVLTDADGRITWTNPGFERITGWTLDEMLGRSPGSLLQCERTDRAEVRRLREALDRRDRFSGELLNRSKDGRDYWVAIDIQPVVAWDGSHAGFMAIETDVTERRALLDGLRDSVALVESVFEALPLPVAMKDADGRIQRLNQAAVEWLGKPREAVVGRTVADLFPLPFARRQEQEDRELLARPGQLRYEITVPAGDGRLTDQVVSKRTVLDASGRAIGTVVALADVTAQRDAARATQEAREAAEAANRAKSVFLATMSHEIRTPMNGVIGMAELLAADPSLPPAVADQVQTIHASGRSLLRLLDDVLDFSKIEAGRLEIESTPFELSALVEGVCHGLWPVAAGRGVALEVFVRPGLPEHRVADPTRLRQVLNNLVSNAIKFCAPDSDRRGRVSVRVEPDAESADGVAIEVADDGIGIDEGAQARLFQPFVQAEASTTRRFGGSGLGLAICRRLVELMGGTIGVSSRPGEGSVFRVRLPLPVDPAGPAGAPAPSLAGVRCRLLRDPSLPLASLHEWLVDEGADVCTVDHADDQGAPDGGDDTAPTVLVCAESAALPDRLPGDAAVLRVGRGRRGTPRRVSDREVAIDLLRRAPFVQAVAAAAQRATLAPEVAAAAVPAHDARVGPPSDAEARAAGQWILVAEDDPTNRKVVVRQLALLGRAAQVVCDGREALLAWREHRHALVLTDLNMPTMDGWSLAQAIRDEEAANGWPRTPLLALTANALKDEAVRARAAGLDDCLTKPVPIAQLRAALAHWMPAPRRASTVAADDGPPAPPPPRVDDEPALDPSVLAGLVGDDPPTIASLLASFGQTLERHAPVLLDAGAAGEAAPLAHAAHVLKSAARSVGAAALADACERVEGLARRGAAVPPETARALARQIGRVREALAAHVEVQA